MTAPEQEYPEGAEPTTDKETFFENMEVLDKGFRQAECPFGCGGTMTALWSGLREEFVLGCDGCKRGGAIEDVQQALNEDVSRMWHGEESENGHSSFSSSPDAPIHDDDDENNDIVWFHQLGEPNPRKYIIEDVGVKGYPLVVYGAGGVAKSFAVLAAGIAIASDGACGEWLGLKVLEHGRVLYLDFELDVDEQHRRVRDLCAGMGIAIPEKLAYLSAVGMTTDLAMTKACAFVKQHDAVAVIVDSAGLAMAGRDMDKAKDVIGFYRTHIDRIRRAGATPLVVDHEGKLQAGEKHKDKAPIGSAYKAWLARSILQFRLEEHDKEASTLDVRVSQSKMNFTPIRPLGVRFTFEAEKVSLEAYEVDDAELVDEAVVPVKNRILAALKVSPATVSDLETLTGAARGTIYNKLSELEQAGQVVVGYKGRQKLYGLFSSSSDTPREGGDDENEASPDGGGGSGANPQEEVLTSQREVLDLARSFFDLDDGEGGSS